MISLPATNLVLKKGLASFFQIIQSLGPILTEEKMPEEIDMHGKIKEARNTFWNVIQNNFYRFINDAPTIWNGPDERFYRTEKDMIAKHTEPFFWGGIITIFLFGTFRISGSKWYAKMRGWSQQSTKMQTQLQNNNRKEWKSHLERMAEKQEAAQKDLLQLPIDFFLSVMCGLSSILWLSKPTEIKNDFVEAPLITGKSIIYETFCNDMEIALSRTVNTEMLKETDSDDTIHTFTNFVHNCHIRKQFIQLQELKGTIQRPDVIPYPGLDGIRRRR